jgi:hypothetical protein
MVTDLFFQPCARIPIFCGEVKDCCMAIIQAEFLAIGSDEDNNEGVKQLAKKQLSQYSYTFPRASKVSGCLTVDSR